MVHVCVCILAFGYVSGHNSEKSGVRSACEGMQRVGSVNDAARSGRAACSAFFLGFNPSWVPPENVLFSTTCLAVTAEAEIALLPEETFNLHLSLSAKKS